MIGVGILSVVGFWFWRRRLHRSHLPREGRIQELESRVASPAPRPADASGTCAFILSSVPIFYGNIPTPSPLVVLPGALLTHLSPFRTSTEAGVITPWVHLRTQTLRVIRHATIGRRGGVQQTEKEKDDMSEVDYSTQPQLQPTFPQPQFITPPAMAVTRSPSLRSPE